MIYLLIGYKKRGRIVIPQNSHNDPDNFTRQHFLAFLKKAEKVSGVTFDVQELKEVNIPCREKDCPCNGEGYLVINFSMDMIIKDNIRFGVQLLNNPTYEYIIKIIWTYVLSFRKGFIDIDDAFQCIADLYVFSGEFNDLLVDANKKLRSN